MIIISHRGNVNGKFEYFENEPSYVDKAIEEGYQVEIDIWYQNNILYLGHDKPQYNISSDWLKERKDKLWIHCKNIEAMEWFNEAEEFTYFWHQEDTLALVSNAVIWAYPGKQPIKNSIAVLPELYNDDVSSCLGVCTDYPKQYENTI